MEREEEYWIGEEVRLNPAIGYSEKQCQDVWKVIEVGTLNITVIGQKPGMCLTKPYSHFKHVENPNHNPDGFHHETGRKNHEQ